MSLLLGISEFLRIARFMRTTPWRRGRRKERKWNSSRLRGLPSESHGRSPTTTSRKLPNGGREVAWKKYRRAVKGNWWHLARGNSKVLVGIRRFLRRGFVWLRILQTNSTFKTPLSASTSPNLTSSESRVSSMIWRRIWEAPSTPNFKYSLSCPVLPRHALPF